MWPAKLPGEGANLYDACVAMCTLMKSIGIAIDGGKDSLSMAARLDNQEIAKSPGSKINLFYTEIIFLLKRRRIRSRNIGYFNIRPLSKHK